MAIPSGAVWEVRTTGSDQNGGFFNASRGGTDYSQQDSPQLVLTDGACSGNTTVTSATGGFTAAMVGNGININGTIYEIVSCQSTNQITIDRNGPNGTGLTLRVGGAVASLSACNSVWENGNIAWVASGNYAVSSQISVTKQVRIYGYSGTRQHGTTNRPVLSASANNQTIVICDHWSGGTAVRDMQFSGNGYSGVRGLELWGGGDSATATDCHFTGCYCRVSAKGAIAFRCTAEGTGGYFWVDNGGAAWGCSMNSPNDLRLGTGCVVGCLVRGGARITSMAGYVCIVNTVVFGSNGQAFDLYYDCRGVVANCIAYGASGYGFGAGTVVNTNLFLFNCAAGACSSGLVKSDVIINNQGFATLTANPFVDSSNGDFRLNNLPGGGALCRAAGIGPVGQISALDIGAVQTASDAQLFIIEDD